jgi:Tfp pilus assembly major pilin PilA
VVRFLLRVSVGLRLIISVGIALIGSVLSIPLVTGFEVRLQVLTHAINLRGYRRGSGVRKLSAKLVWTRTWVPVWRNSLDIDRKGSCFDAKLSVRARTASPFCSCYRRFSNACERYAIFALPLRKRQ